MIKIKSGQCADCKKDRPLTAGRCQNCYWKYRAEVKKAEKEAKGIEAKKVKIYKIPRQTKKRAQQNILYLKKRRIFIEQNTICAAKLKGCTYLTTEIHHLEGRIGDRLTDENNFIGLCHNCHCYVEAHPEFAKQNNFSRNRL